MEASKCPKCGEEPHFVDQLEKWYCYGCNSYVEEGEQHVCDDHANEAATEAKAIEIAKELKSLDEDELPACHECGATLDKHSDGKSFCPVCESGPDAHVPAAVVGTKAEKIHNDSQAILDSITVATPVEPIPKVIPAPQPEVKKEPAVKIKMCSVCGQPLKYIEKYDRHYCYGCRKYAPKEKLEKKPEPIKTAPPATKKCPDCGYEMKFIEKYSEFYCHTCKKYPLRVHKKPGDLRCPKCGRPLRLIEKYQRHYCMACKEYAPKGYGQGPTEKKICPGCNEQMRWISEYNEWYCHKCKKYSLRPATPVLLV